MIKNISNLGDAALYCDFGKEINKETNTNVIRYFKSIQKENIEGVNNLTPSYNKLIVSFDLRKTNFEDLKRLIESSKGNTRKYNKHDFGLYGRWEALGRWTCIVF